MMQSAHRCSSSSTSPGHLAGGATRAAHPQAPLRRGTHPLEILLAPAVPLWGLLVIQSLLGVVGAVLLGTSIAHPPLSSSPSSVAPPRGPHSP
ncbi:MAG: hypothetical protein R2722_10305 [Tessaracoccus sp.]